MEAVALDLRVDVETTLWREKRKAALVTAPILAVGFAVQFGCAGGAAQRARKRGHAAILRGLRGSKQVSTANYAALRHEAH